MQSRIYKVQLMICIIGYLGVLIPCIKSSLVDYTFAGLGTNSQYTGSFVNAFLDSNANTVSTSSPSDNLQTTSATTSPYAIVNIGYVSLQNSVTFPNYPTTNFPALTRLNRSGSADTVFAQNQPGTGFANTDPFTGTAFSSNQNNILLCAKGLYYLVNTGTSGQVSITRYLPMSARMDASFGTSGTVTLNLNNTSNTQIPSAHVMGACIDPNTLKIYLVYNDGTNAYVGALSALNANYYADTSYTYDTSFNTTGVVEFTAATISGATAITFTGIGFDDYTNRIVAIGNTSGNLELVVATFSLTGLQIQYTAFVSGGANPSFTATDFSWVLPKYASIIENSVSTSYYYLVGYHNATNLMQIMYFDPITTSLKTVNGTNLATISTKNGTSNNIYTPTSVIQMPDATQSNSVAIVVGNNISVNKACVIDFQLENVALDIAGTLYAGSVPTVEEDGPVTFVANDTNTSFCSAAYDSSVYVKGGVNPQGLIIAANRTSQTAVVSGVIANYYYDNSTFQMTLLTGSKLGVALFDYQSSNYPAGFTFYTGVYSIDYAGHPSYYILASGNAGSDYDMGIVRYDLNTMAFDMNYSGSIGNPFYVIASHVKPYQACYLSNMQDLYCVGVATSFNTNPNNFVIAAASLKGSAGALDTTNFFATSQSTSKGIISYNTTQFGMSGASYLNTPNTAFSDVAITLQTISAVQEVVVSGINENTPFIARFHAANTPTNSVDGILDSTFTAQGFVLFQSAPGTLLIPNSVFNNCAVDGNNNIVAVGGINSGTSQGKVIVARYTSSGVLDTTFNTSGYGSFSLVGLTGTGYTTTVTTAALDSSNNVYIGGTYNAYLLTNPGGSQSSSNTSAVPFIQKILSTGSADQKFSNNTYGTFIISAQAAKNASANHMAINQLILDTSSQSGLTIPGTATSVSTMYAVGSFNGIASIMRFGTTMQSSTSGGAASGWQSWTFL